MAELLTSYQAEIYCNNYKTLTCGLINRAFDLSSPERMKWYRDGGMSDITLLRGRVKPAQIMSAHMFPNYAHAVIAEGANLVLAPLAAHEASLLADGIEAVCEMLCPNPRLMADLGAIMIDAFENLSDWGRAAAAARRRARRDDDQHVQIAVAKLLESAALYRATSRCIKSFLTNERDYLRYRLARGL
jgi:hypothetical protein